MRASGGRSGAAHPDHETAVRAAIRTRTLVMLGIILFFVVSLNGLNVVNSYVGRGFMTSLDRRQVAAFYTLRCITPRSSSPPRSRAVLSQFFEDRLALFWRQSLTQHLLDQYLKNQAYFHLHAKTEIDNPDQRLSEDVKRTPDDVAGLLPAGAELLHHGRCVRRRPVVDRAGLFVAAVVYAVLGSGMTLLLG